MNFDNVFLCNFQSKNDHFNVGIFGYAHIETSLEVLEGK